MRSFETYKQCGLMPRHMRNIKNKHKEWAEAFRKAEAMLGNGSIIALIGPRGTGKTQLAASLIKSVLIVMDDNKFPEFCKWQLYMTAMQFFMRIKRSYDGREHEEGIIKALLAPPLLVIDELQERRCSDWENSLLTTLIDTRYGNMKDTVLISNQTVDAFVRNVGDSVADRMNEGGGVIEMNWQSLRGGGKVEE